MLDPIFHDFSIFIVQETLRPKSFLIVKRKRRNFKYQIPWEFLFVEGMHVIKVSQHLMQSRNSRVFQ